MRKRREVQASVSILVCSFYLLGLCMIRLHNDLIDVFWDHFASLFKR
jgi:hypothetical protein